MIVDMNYLFVLGSHPALSASETIGALKAQGYGPIVRSLTDGMLIVATAKTIPARWLATIGGIDRIAEVLTQSAEPWEPAAMVAALAPEKGKCTLGFSVLTPITGPALSPAFPRLKDLATEVKKIMRSQGSPVRFILAGKQRRLNAAQVIFNKLIHSPNAEFLLAHLPDQYVTARTLAIQDIQAYEVRDTARPARDPHRGMLPPKVAQMTLNLARAQLPTPSPVAILDPFCGTGTVLQEGWLLGERMIGMDSDPGMIQATKTNLAWVARHFALGSTPPPQVLQHDVRRPWPLHQTIDAIVTEPHLGRPLSSPLPQRLAAEFFNEVAPLYEAFFKNAHTALKPTGLILFLLPAIMAKRSISLFPEAFIDEIEGYGYRKMQLIPEELAAHFSVHDRSQLVYARPQAFIGREFTLWQKR